MKFNSYIMKDLISEISMGPFGSNIKVECFVDSGIPVLNGSNLTGYALNEASFRYVTEEKADSLRKANAYRGDIVITHRGTLGQIVFIPMDSKYDRYVISQSQFRVKCNEKILPEYLVYYFHTNVGQYKLLSNASQVGVPALARASTTFQMLEIDVPEISEQRKIVALLECIREKIELNNKINDNLEQQMQSLFINHLSKNEKFNITTVEDVVLTANTGADAIQKAPIVDYNTGIRCIRVGDMTNKRSYYNWGYAKVTNEVFKRYQLHKDDILVTRTASLGLNMIISDDLQAVYNNGLIRLSINKEKILPIFLYRQFQTNDFSNYISRIESETSVRPNMKINYLLNYTFTLPSIEEQKKLIHLIDPMMKQQNILIIENKCLTELRDNLLPKLMSGEIDVTNIKI